MSVAKSRVKVASYYDGVAKFSLASKPTDSDRYI